MADFNPLSGTLADVLVGDTAYAFDKWDLDMSMNLPIVNNFLLNAQQIVVGIYKGKIELEGPYDQGNMPFSVGVEYDWILRYTQNVSVVIAGKIESIHPTVDVEDAARVRITVQSNGAFTASIT